MTTRPGGRTSIDTIRVALVEDNAQYRQSIGVLLEHAPGFALLASTHRAEWLLAEAQRASAPPWDLVLMDLGLPGMDGIEATRRLKVLWPDVKVVALTVFEEPGTILDAIAGGVDGYLLKKTSATELLSVLRGVFAGGAPLTPGIARMLLDLVRVEQRRRGANPGSSVGRLDLSDREQDVLRGLVRGLSYKQVADECGTSLDTVRTHVRTVYRKLQVHNVAEAVARAIRERLV